MEPARYTAEDNVPAWAVGKTAAEVLDMTSNLMQTMQTYEAPAQPPASPQPQYGNVYNTAPPAVTPLAQPDPELALTNAPEYQRQLDVYMGQREDRLVDRLGAQLQGYMQPVTSTMGTLARSQVATDPNFAQVFSRYGHEIDQEFVRNNIPVTNRTPDSYRMVAEMVQGRHWKEFAREEAVKLASEGVGQGTARSSVGPGNFEGSSGGDALDEAWEDDVSFFSAMRAQGLNKSDVREAARKQGLPIDKWVKMVSGSNVFIAPDGKHVQMRRQIGGENA